ncbi:MAG TPA: serine hydrolase domain-containing protein, partial [Sediminibacterium sp.]
MRYVFLAALCSLCMLLHAQKKKTPAGIDHFAGLDTAFERVLKDWHGAGFAVAVVKKDSVLFAKGFGYSDISKKTPVTVNTLFPIGSCTKAFTVFLIGLLDRDGKVDIDKPVR